MIFRKTKTEDIPRVMEIINKGKAYFKSEGIDQWQNGYPNEETIETDINNGEGYILERDNEIVGTVAVSFNGEATYDKIYEGSWLTSGDFGVIHRIAVDSDLKGEGLAGQIFKSVQALCLKNSVHSIKIDTHKDNQSMRKSIAKNGFAYCGVIYLEDGSERVAFEINF